MIQKDTKNKSFINMWRFCQDNNIKDQAFMLYTINEKLLDFDTSNLSNDDYPDIEEWRALVIDECVNNIWYFFREVARVPHPVWGDEYSVPFHLDIQSMLMIKAYENKHSFFIGYHTPITGLNTTFRLLLFYELFISGYNPIIKVGNIDIAKAIETKYTIPVLKDLQHIINSNLRVVRIYEPYEKIIEKYYVFSDRDLFCKHSIFNINFVPLPFTDKDLELLSNAVISRDTLVVGLSEMNATQENLSSKNPIAYKCIFNDKYSVEKMESIENTTIEYLCDIYKEIDYDGRILMF